MADQKKLQRKAKIVKIPGIGLVEFPGSMSDEDIAGQIRGLTGAGKVVTGARGILEEAPPAIGATIGAAAGTPFGPPGRIAGAGIGAGIGEATKTATVGQFPTPGGRLGGPRLQLPIESFDDVARSAGEFALLEGVFAGFGKLFRRLRGPTLTQRSLARPEVKLATERGVELTLSQTTQSPFIIGFESILKRAIGTQPSFQKQQLRQNVQITRLFDKLASNISKQQDRRTVGLALGETSRAIRKEAGAALGQIEDSIISKSPSGIINFTKEQSNKILQNIKALEEIEAAAGTPSGVTGALKNIRDILFPAGEPLTIGEALIAAKNIRQIADTRSGRVGFFLSRARGDLLDAIADSLGREGLGTEARQLRTARARFREIAEALNTSFIRSLQKFKQPESVGRMLAISGTGLSKAEIVKAIFKGEIPNPVRRAFVEEILNQSTQEGVLIGNLLENVIDKRVGADVIRAVLKPEEASFLLKDIKTLANLIDLPVSTTRPLSSASSSLLAFGQSQQAAAGVGAFATQGSVLGLAAATLTLGIPAYISKKLTSKGGAELLKRAARVKATSAEGLKLLPRLLAITEGKRLLRRNNEIPSTIP
jgi:hypothetical protein